MCIEIVAYLFTMTLDLRIEGWENLCPVFLSIIGLWFSQFACLQFVPWAERLKGMGRLQKYRSCHYYKGWAGDFSLVDSRIFSSTEVYPKLHNISVDQLFAVGCYPISFSISEPPYSTFSISEPLTSAADFASAKPYNLERFIAESIQANCKTFTCQRHQLQPGSMV